MIMCAKNLLIRHTSTELENRVEAVSHCCHFPGCKEEIKQELV